MNAASRVDDAARERGAGRLRIAVWHNLPSGGGKRALHDQVRGLSARGHHVEAWCPDTADRDYLPLGTLIPEHVVPLDAPAPRPRRLGSRFAPWRSVVERMDVMDRHCRACAAQVEAGGFDVLLAHPCAAFRSSPIGLHVSIPSRLYLQEPYREFYEATPRLPWIDPLLPHRAGRVERLCREAIALQGLRSQARRELEWAAGFGGILVNSLFSRESVMRAYGLDSDVCYLGVDASHFRPPAGPKEPFVVGLGSIHPNKRVELAIEAAACIEAPARPRLVWIGNFADGAYARSLGDLARRLGVRFEPRVRIADDELIDLLGRAACMIYAPRLEPFGYAPLEANACGTAVVALAEGGVRETVQDGINGFVVHRCDPGALARPVERLATDLGLASELGRAARRHVEQTWDYGRSIDRIEDALRAAVGERPAQDRPLSPVGQRPGGPP